MRKFSYSEFFQAIMVLQKLLGGEQESPWLLTPPREPRPTPTVVYLGCNILRTVHLAQTITRLLNALGEDYVAVGGPAFCCGAVHRTMGDLEPSERMLDHALTLFGRFRPDTVVNWCPSCEMQFDSMLSDRTKLSYRIIPFAEFLAQRLKGRGGVGSLVRRVALHGHTGSAQADRDTAYIEHILGQIRGLEIVKLPAHPELRQHCTRLGCIRDLGAQRYRRIVEEDMAQAREGGAEAVVSIYHSCHRELCSRGRGQLPIVNYVTLVAKVLGVDLPEDEYQRYATDNYESAAATLIPKAEALGIRRDVAEAVLRSEFATQ